MSAIAKKPILVVDDNEPNRYATRRVLETAGYHTREAGSGSEALQLVGTVDPSLVILDVKLPDIDGVEVCRQIKANPDTRKIPVMHLSGHRKTQANQAEGISGGAEAYLTRPIEPGLLIATVQSLIQAKESEKAELAAVLAARDEALSMAAHEMKAPLTTFGLQLHLLQRAAENIPHNPANPPRSLTQIFKYVGICQAQNERLTRLVDQLLDVTRMGFAEGLSLRLEKADLRKIVEDAASPYRQVPIDIKGFQDNSPVMVVWDSQRMVQVIGNLLSNAIKYGEGKPVHVRLSYTDTEVVVDVKDEGVGVAEVDFENIFSLYRRASNPSGAEGLGLGLYIVKQVTKAHGGDAAVRSKVGEGSTFSLRLPRYVHVASTQAETQ